MTMIEELRLLPLAERRRIVDELTASIREEEDLAESPELVAELRNRSAQLKCGSSPGIPWAEVENRILARRG